MNTLGGNQMSLVLASDILRKIRLQWCRLWLRCQRFRQLQILGWDRINLSNAVEQGGRRVVVRLRVTMSKGSRKVDALLGTAAFATAKPVRGRHTKNRSRWIKHSWGSVIWSKLDCSTWTWLLMAKPLTLLKAQTKNRNLVRHPSDIGQYDKASSFPMICRYNTQVQSWQKTRELKRIIPNVVKKRPHHSNTATRSGCPTTLTTCQSTLN